MTIETKGTTDRHVGSFVSIVVDIKIVLIICLVTALEALIVSIRRQGGNQKTKVLPHPPP